MLESLKNLLHKIYYAVFVEGDTLKEKSKQKEEQDEEHN